MSLRWKIASEICQKMASLDLRTALTVIKYLFDTVFIFIVMLVKIFKKILTATLVDILF